MTQAPPTQDTSPCRTDGAKRDDDGFTLVFFAFAIVALLGIAALVVDVGYWYLHADRIQRAADAAALAGVVYMPGDLTSGTGPSATSVADHIAQANGIVGSNYTVSATAVPGQPHQLKVSITDDHVPTFFAKIFGLNSIDETRSSIAEYQPPVPLGSPENSIGTGTDTDTASGNATNLWAAVNGYCTSKENGDEFLSAFDATWSGSNWTCGPAGTPATAVNNYEYDPSDYYYYDIMAPAGTTNPLVIQAFDPAYEPSKCGTGTTPDLSLGGGSQINTFYTVTYAPQPLDHTQDTGVSVNDPGSTSTVIYSPNDGVADDTVEFESGDGPSCGTWTTLYTIPDPTPGGEYRLHVYTQAGEANSDGSNEYGLRVFDNGTSAFTPCTSILPTPSIPQPNYSASCPVIQGENAISVYANQGGSTGSFYLADIDPTYDGKTMTIDLFDPGEGDQYIQVLSPPTATAPDGTPQYFTYTTTDSCPLAADPASPDCAGGPGVAPGAGIGFPTTLSGIAGTGSFNGEPVDDALDVSQKLCTTCGDGTTPAGIEGSGSLASSSLFNDRHVQLTVTIPDDSPGGWWSIKYYSTSAVTDRTTWSVSLNGSPIHLAG